MRTELSWPSDGTARRKNLVTRALGLLSPLRDRVLGTVLTRVDLRRLRGYDYYQSSAYSKSYHDDAGARQAARS